MGSLDHWSGPGCGSHWGQRHCRAGRTGVRRITEVPAVQGRQWLSARSEVTGRPGCFRRRYEDAGR